MNMESTQQHESQNMNGAWVANEKALADPELLIDVQGFEGPLDLLLHLARNQKVDLARISVVALVEQYLDFVEQARRLRLELAADYLVMAAWLAYLKSRLLIPRQSVEDGASGEELAEVLQFRLRRLEAMRHAAQELLARNRLGRDVFARGLPEAVVVERKNLYDTTLYELLTAYTGLRQRNAATSVEMGKRTVWSLKQARQILTRLLGQDVSHNWQALNGYLAAFVGTEEERVTALASSFAASLELVREGQLEIRQSGNFAPLYIKGRKAVREDV
ncbi:MAG: Chromosome segregation and condensation protein ScpA [Candidatus Tokpelaia hoelldobleri]|uniref:Segregation and condensation protein A n=1 Tax=Candidatus Tokpelaia hoelldobleri TaxID=1902579 RepID=A0A1U9JU71_9HYPH|nr:MAG: Chromosome segregation and condensation protein ScpA [Candidatus Tokpelaia hoelldoblerii]